jgi:hypothetical protein
MAEDDLRKPSGAFAHAASANPLRRHRNDGAEGRITQGGQR